MSQREQNRFNQLVVKMIGEINRRIDDCFANISAGGGGGGGGGGSYNYLINGGFSYAQRQTAATLTTISDKKYGADRWMLTRENADVQYQRNDATGETGLTSKYYGLVKKITNTGKFMMLQVVEGENSIPLHGQSVTFEIKMKASAAKTIRMAIIEIQSGGTMDTLPATLISAWGADSADPTLGSNLAIVTSAESKSVTTSWQKFSVTKTLPSTSKNFVCAIWSDSQFAANDTLSLAEGGMYLGVAPNAWMERLVEDELVLVSRFYQRTNFLSAYAILGWMYVLSDGVTGFTSFRLSFPMRTNNITFSCSNVAHFYIAGATYVCSAFYLYSTYYSDCQMVELVGTFAASAADTFRSFEIGNYTTAWWSFDAEIY